MVRPTPVWYSAIFVLYNTIRLHGPSYRYTIYLQNQISSIKMMIRSSVPTTLFTTRSDSEAEGPYRGQLSAVERREFGFRPIFLHLYLPSLRIEHCSTLES